MVKLQKQILSIKTIFNSMISTLLILILLMGFIVVEKNTRKIGFADNNPWFIYKDSNSYGHYFKVRFMNESFVVDFSGLYDVTDAILNYVNQLADTVKNMSGNM